MGCYRKILVALDGSSDARAGLQHAATLAGDQHARLVVLTVVPAPKPVTSVGGPTLVTDHESASMQELNEAVGALPANIGVESRLTTGRPARRILEVAEQSGCDLIVMGCHGHGRLHQALIGSVSDTVLRESRLPVLLVRACQPAADEAVPSPVG